MYFGKSTNINLLWFFFFCRQILYLKFIKFYSLQIWHICFNSLTVIRKWMSRFALFIYRIDELIILVYLDYLVTIYIQRINTFQNKKELNETTFCKFNGKAVTQKKGFLCQNQLITLEKKMLAWRFFYMNVLTEYILRYNVVFCPERIIAILETAFLYSFFFYSFTLLRVKWQFMCFITDFFSFLQWTFIKLT